MEVSRRAIFNLLRLAQAGGLALPGVQEWEIREYRSLSDAALLDALAATGLPMTKEEFLALCHPESSPEKLAATLLDDSRTDEEADQAHLLIFELWRRFCPEYSSLSLFCDALDHLMSDWYGEVEGAEHGVRSLLVQLQNCLIEADQIGRDPETAFAWFKEGCSNQLEGFLYDYGRSLLEQEERESELNELIDIFGHVVADGRWFDLLRAAQDVLCGASPEEVYTQIEASLYQDWSAPLALELLQDLLDFDLVAKAVQLLGLGLMRATLQQEAIEFLEACVLLAHGLDLEGIEGPLSMQWQHAVLHPLKPFSRTDQEQAVTCLHTILGVVRDVS